MCVLHQKWLIFPSTPKHHKKQFKADAAMISKTASVRPTVFSQRLVPSSVVCGTEEFHCHQLDICIFFSLCGRGLPFPKTAHALKINVDSNVSDLNKWSGNKNNNVGFLLLARICQVPGLKNLPARKMNFTCVLLFRIAFPKKLDRKCVQTGSTMILLVLFLKQTFNNIAKPLERQTHWCCPPCPLCLKSLHSVAQRTERQGLRLLSGRSRSGWEPSKSGRNS